MSIREATINDVEEIQSLILKAAQPESNADFTKEGIAHFKATLELNAIKDRIQNKQYLMLCFIKQQEIVGLIAIYKKEKLSQLFVDPSARKLNIAKKLWLAAHALCTGQGGPGSYWVKSSTMAIPVYESFGFRLDTTKQNTNGIVYHLMLLET